MNRRRLVDASIAAGCEIEGAVRGDARRALKPNAFDVACRADLEVRERLRSRAAVEIVADGQRRQDVILRNGELNHRALRRRPTPLAGAE